jgi:hypothetical protein
LPFNGSRERLTTVCGKLSHSFLTPVSTLMVLTPLAVMVSHRHSLASFLSLVNRATAESVANLASDFKLTVLTAKITKIKRRINEAKHEFLCRFE